jgi:nucleotide-binding universal stress UspA family protein
MNTTVLVAVDYSENDEKLIQKAIALAKGTEISIVLLHVFSFFDPLPTQGEDQPEKTATASDSSPGPSPQTWESLEKTSLDKLQTYVQQVEAPGISVTSYHVLGHPAPIICKLARELDVDTILIGRGGHRGMAKAILGSVSNYVFHHAPCSVWVITGR